MLEDCRDHSQRERRDSEAPHLNQKKKKQVYRMEDSQAVSPMYPG